MSSLDALVADMRARADEMGIVYTYVEVLRILDALKERDVTIAAALARAEAAEREVAALKEGLRPFADLAGTYTVETMPADGIFTLTNKAVWRTSRLKVSHLRRAAALLSPDDETRVAAERAEARSQRDDRRKAVIREVVTWLHERAAAMNDPHAQGVLNSAALYVGERGARLSPDHKTGERHDD